MQSEHNGTTTDTTDTTNTRPRKSRRSGQRVTFVFQGEQDAYSTVVHGYKDIPPGFHFGFAEMDGGQFGELHGPENCAIKLNTRVPVIRRLRDKGPHAYVMFFGWMMREMYLAADKQKGAGKRARDEADKILKSVCTIITAKWESVPE